MSEEALLVVYFFRQVGIFIRILGLELSPDTVARATDIISTHGLDEHIQVIHKDVMHVNSKYIEDNNIDIIYTTATASHFFFWKLYLLALSSAAVQAVVLPSCELVKLKNLDGSSLHYMDNTKCKKPHVNKLCNCWVSVRLADTDEGEQRDLKILHMHALRDENTAQYISDILTNGLWYTVDTVLKPFLRANNSDRVRHMIEALDVEPITGSKQICTGVHTFRVKADRLTTWKRQYVADGNEEYALTYIRHKIKVHVVSENTFLDQWPKTILDSAPNTYTADDINYIHDAWEAFDHPLLPLIETRRHQWRNAIRQGGSHGLVDEGGGGGGAEECKGESRTVDEVVEGGGGEGQGGSGIVAQQVDEVDEVDEGGAEECKGESRTVDEVVEGGGGEGQGGSGIVAQQVDEVDEGGGGGGDEDNVPPSKRQRHDQG